MKEMRRPVGVKGLSMAASAALMMALLILSRPAGVSGAAFIEWTLPPSGAMPYGIAATGGLPTIWFVEHTVSRLGRLDPTTGEIKEYQLPAGRPWDIKLDTDPSGNFRSAWISFYQKFAPPGTSVEEYYIGKYDGSDLHLFKIPIAGDVKPRGIWLERDPMTPQLDVKYVWIAMEGGYIGRLDPVNPQAGSTWSFSYWKLPSDAKPVSIIFVPMYGGVFYTDEGRDVIGFLNPYPSATLVEWPAYIGATKRDSNPWGIAVDKDGNIWFTEAGSPDGRSRIGKLNPYTNVLTEYRIPTDNAEPRGILVDNVDELGRLRPGFAGRIWIAEHRGNKIAKFDPEGNTFVEFTRAVSGAPHGLAMDLTASPKIWFTDEGGARIGRIDPNIAIAATSTNFISTATTSVTTQTAAAGATTSYTFTAPGTAATTVATSMIGNFITSTWTSTTASTYYEATETSQVLIGTTYVTVTEVSASTRSTTVPATWTETITVAPSTSTALVSATTTTMVSTTTMTIPITATSTSLYLTTTHSTSTTTTTQTVVTTATYITAAAGPPGAPAIPGFPIESIAIGLSAGLSALALAGRGRRRRA